MFVLLNLFPLFYVRYIPEKKLRSLYHVSGIKIPRFPPVTMLRKKHESIMEPFSSSKAEINYIFDLRDCVIQQSFTLDVNQNILCTFWEFKKTNFCQLLTC